MDIAPPSYYRWRRQRACERGPAPLKPVPPFEATAEEKTVVLKFARKHSALRHRELAWRTVDEGVACLSPATVYRILKEQNRVYPWRRRTKRYPEV